MLSNLCNPEKLEKEKKTFLGEAYSPTCTYRCTKYKHAKPIKAEMCAKNDKAQRKLSRLSESVQLYLYFLLDTEET